MADLIAKTPCAGLVPLHVGTVSLTEGLPEIMTSVAPFKGQDKALSDALKAAHGMGFPAPNRVTPGTAGARAVWMGQRQAMLIGPEPSADLSRHAALTDQSDAWAMVQLEGAGCEDVLARLVPVDLRAQVFKPGHTVRSNLMHMTASVTCTREMTFQIMVFRSMAATLVHDLKTAMEAVAARG